MHHRSLDPGQTHLMRKSLGMRLMILGLLLLFLIDMLASSFSTAGAFSLWSMGVCPVVLALFQVRTNLVDQD